jgi:serine/threonine-protein kinase
MAPERFYGEPASAQSDLYALGLILYEVVTGTAALTVSSPLEWPSAHAISAPSDPSAIVTDTDPALVQVIMRCLEKDAANRPSSAAQVAAALPGGDPLAAAVAAGETPSPELVAASGEEGTLPRGKAVAWFATAVATLGLAVWSVSSVLLINHTSMPFDTGALERQARELMVSLGYTTPPADWRSLWRRDTRREPHMIRLTYRQSPQSLFETVQNPTPWPEFPEDARMYLDSRGRLLGLDIGGDRDYSDTTGAKPTDWEPMLAALGADAPPVPSTPGRWPPAFYADTRAAWTATIDGVPHDVEAASLRGRPVSLRVKPVDAPDERPVAQRGAGALRSAITSFTVILVLALLVTLARRNVRRGRGDRPGATRLALAVGLTFVIGFAVTRHWNFEAPNLVAQGIFYTVQLPLTLGVLVWLGYVGVEPYVRRRWPFLLVGWARLLEGRIRDGLVGQALLAGVTVGAILATMRAGLQMLMASVGTSSPYLYRDGWQWVASPLFAIGGTIFGSVVLVGLLVAARLFLRRDWAAWWVIGMFVAVVAMGGGNRADVVRADLPMWVLLLIGVTSAALAMWLFRRFGLLALVIAGSVNGMLLDAPLTLDPAHWYFWRGAWVMAIVLVLAVWGFVNVLGKQSLIPVEALDS